MIIAMTMHQAPECTYLSAQDKNIDSNNIEKGILQTALGCDHPVRQAVQLFPHVSLLDNTGTSEQPLTCALMTQDYKNIEAGYYKLPWDMTTLRNRQYDPFHVLSTISTFATEASNTLRRRFKGSPERVWMQSSMYPEYYLNTFHYQVRSYCCYCLPWVHSCRMLLSLLIWHQSTWQTEAMKAFVAQICYILQPSLCASIISRPCSISYASIAFYFAIYAVFYAA